MFTINMITYSEIINQLKEKPYAEIPIPISRRQIEKAADAFIVFLSLPQEVKQKFNFIIEPEGDWRSSKSGYWLYEKEKGATDDKEFFHYNEFVDEHCKELLNLNNEKINNFLNEARNMYNETKKLFQEFMKTFDKEHPGIYEKFFPKGQKSRFILRFNAYPKQNNQTIALPHYDRGSFTLALGQSNQGLQIGWNDKDISLITHKNGIGLFMPGISFHNITSKVFKPAWHNAIQTTDYNENFTRWSIVFFANYVGMPNVSYETAHTPISDHL